MRHWEGWRPRQPQVNQRLRRRLRRAGTRANGRGPHPICSGLVPKIPAFVREAACGHPWARNNSTPTPDWCGRPARRRLFPPAQFRLHTFPGARVGRRFGVSVAPCETHLRVLRIFVVTLLGVFPRCTWEGAMGMGCPRRLGCPFRAGPEDELTLGKPGPSGGGLPRAGMGCPFGTLHGLPDAGVLQAATYPGLAWAVPSGHCTVSLTRVSFRRRLFRSEFAALPKVLSCLQRTSCNSVPGGDGI